MEKLDHVCICFDECVKLIDPSRLTLCLCNQSDGHFSDLLLVLDINAFRVIRKVQWVIMSVLVSSCASIFNSKTTSVRVFTEEPSAIKVNDKEVEGTSKEHWLTTPRSRNNLTIELFTQDTAKRVEVKSQLSSTFFLNFNFFWSPVGAIIDMTNEKRFTYPRNVYVEFDKNLPSYFTTKPLDTVNRLKKNIVKFSLTKPFSFSPGGLSFSWERKLSWKMTTQLSVSILASRLSYPKAFKGSDLRGIDIGLATRFFWGYAAPKGGYFQPSLSFRKSTHRLDVTQRATNQYYTIEYDERIGVATSEVVMDMRVGKQFFFDRWVIDGYVGLGIGFGVVSHFDKINQDARIVRGVNPLRIDAMDNSGVLEGNGITLTIPIGLKIGYLF